MFDYDRWHEIYIALNKNRVRSAITAFGVFWAVFMLVVMLGTGNGLFNGMKDGVKDFATNSGFMWAQSTTKAYGGFGRGRSWALDNQDMLTIGDQISEIIALCPRLQTSRVGDNVTFGKRAGSFAIMGDYPSYRLMDPSTMLYGRYINNEDIRLKRKVCIIGERVHEMLFMKNEDPSGKFIQVNGVYFMVVGVVRSNNPNIKLGGNKMEMVTIPFTTMQQTFNFGNRVQYFGVLVQPNCKVEVIMARITTILQKNHSISPEDDEAIGKYDVQSMVTTVESVLLGINLLIWIVGVGTLIAGAVGIGNIMLVVVKERTREIGIMRALGASPMDIVNQVLYEAVFLTTLSGFLGLASGTLFLYGTDMAINVSRRSTPSEDHLFFLNPGIGWSLALVSFALLVVIGFFAGLAPALQAIKIKPIDALKEH